MVKDKALKYIFLLYVGGIIYTIVELIARGYSHWTMFILGGICFIALGMINESLRRDTSILLQMLMGCAVITALEFLTGCLVNIFLGWNVWDYSNKFCNFLGQICLENCVYWYLLSAVGIILDDFIRWKWFDEEKPRYRL